MKITLTIEQLKAYEQMAPEERKQFITTCEELETLDEKQVENYTMPADSDLALEIHARVKRYHRNRRRRLKRAAKKATAITTATPSAPQHVHADNRTNATISIDNPSARNTAWVRTNFKRFADRTLEAIRMVSGDLTYDNMAETWQMFTSLIYKTLTPVFEYCAAYLETPNNQRQPESIRFHPELFNYKVS